MSDTEVKARQAVPLMPAGAPSVRILTCIGCPDQKTWSLKRVATLIGSRRPAHIIVHHPDVSDAHCAIVNTGSDVILMDLCTAVKTRLNGQATDYISLNDGDVVGVGDTEFTVKISSDRGLTPTAAPREDAGQPWAPLCLRDQGSGKIYRLQRQAAMIGRRSGADISIGSDQVSDAHALLFCSGSTWMLLDLGARTGVVLNRWPVRLSALGEGDVFQIGPVVLVVAGATDAQSPGPGTGPRSNVQRRLAQQPWKQCAGWPSPVEKKPGTGRAKPLTGRVPVARDQIVSAGPREASPSLTRGPGSTGRPKRVSVSGADPLRSPGQRQPQRVSTRLEASFAQIKADLDMAWERLNKWKLEVAGQQDALDHSPLGLSRQVVDMDARDAAIRGLLHDLTRYHEQLVGCQAQMSQLLADHT